MCIGWFTRFTNKQTCSRSPSLPLSSRFSIKSLTLIVIMRLKLSFIHWNQSENWTTTTTKKQKNNTTVKSTNITNHGKWKVIHFVCCTHRDDINDMHYLDIVCFTERRSDRPFFLSPREHCYKCLVFCVSYWMLNSVWANCLWYSIREIKQL